MDRCPFERESSLPCLRGLAFPVRGCDFLAGEDGSVPVAGLPVFVAICFDRGQHRWLEIILVEKRSEAVVVGIESSRKASAPAVDLNDVVVRVAVVLAPNQEVKVSGIYFTIPVYLEAQMDWSESLEEGAGLVAAYVVLPAAGRQGGNDESGQNPEGKFHCSLLRRLGSRRIQTIV